MRLVWALRYVPLPSRVGGDALYSRKLVEHTSAYAHVDALAFETPGGILDHPGLTWHLVPQRPHSNLRSLLAPVPNIAYRHRQPAYLNRLADLARGADAVIIDHIGLHWAVGDLRARLGPACPPLVVVNHNHEASLRPGMARGTRNPVMAAVMRFDTSKAVRLEAHANRAADGLTAITPLDEEAFAADAPGVPTLLLMPGYDGPRLPQRTIDASVPERLCIVGGRITFYKKLVLDMILEALHAAGIQKRYIVDVVGGGIDDVEAARKKYPGVNFLGFVDDLAEYSRGVRLALIPDEVGGGFKLRALTHVFLRTPMLALKRALQGMTLREDTDFIAVETIPQMIERIPHAMADVTRLDTIQRTAFDHCEGRFEWTDRGAAVVSFAASLQRTTLATDAAPVG
jgi:polysaccharide biosynthesis protein PslH